MQLCFQNSYISKLWVACAWADDNCVGLVRDATSPVEGWDSGAWWGIESGETVETNVSTGNRYFYAYAESGDGHVWGGRYGPFGLEPGPVYPCAWNDGLPVRMHQVDAGWWHWLYDSYTLTFL
jgi:hypothetical protein